jgi:hypothetical protein
MEQTKEIETSEELKIFIKKMSDTILDINIILRGSVTFLNQKDLVEILNKLSTLQSQAKQHGYTEMVEKLDNLVRKVNSITQEAYNS